MKNCKRAKITVKKFIIKNVNSEEIRFFLFYSACLRQSGGGFSIAGRKEEKLCIIRNQKKRRNL